MGPKFVIPTFTLVLILCQDIVQYSKENTYQDPVSAVLDYERSTTVSNAGIL